MPYAEEVSYWRTGKSSPDAKIDDAARMIAAQGGAITGKGYLMHGGREAFLLAFAVGGETYKILWPVLPVKRPDKTSEQAARLQAATFVWHSVKAKCSDAAVLGFRAAFAGNLLCYDGRTLAEVATPELAHAIPARLTYQPEEDSQ